MPLKGKNHETGTEALIMGQFDLLRTWQRAGVLVCPLCDEPLVTVREHLRDGDWVQGYMRHRGECSTTYAHHPESPEHLAAKAWIRDFIPEVYGYAIDSADCEVRIPEVYGYAIDSADCEVRIPEINRIADVCFFLTNGNRMIHEAQLAAISIDDLEARTNDYQSLGFGIIWHFGKAADTGANKIWATRRLGGCELITFDEQIVGV